MMKRMVIGLPRSGTTWAANWLTYGGELTAHDPLYFHHYSEWRTHPGFSGVACTGIWRWPEFVLAQRCPIVVLHRPLGDIRGSLERFDVEDKGKWLEDRAPAQLRALVAPNIFHHEWTDIFDPGAAKAIWRTLEMGMRFDVRRHQELVRMQVQPLHPHPPDAPHHLYSRLMAELREKDERAKNVV